MTVLIDEGMGLAQAADEAGLKLRLLGGVGVVAHCPKVLAGKPHREIADIDVAVTRRDARALTGFLEGRGYTAEKRFNALHGDTRMIFHGPAGKLDVFVGSFELNAKDAHDASVLLTEHPVQSGDGDHIDAAYISRLTGDDWGLWRTVTATLHRLSELYPAVTDRCRQLSDAIEAAPKTRRFKLRARVGERVRWYELPEETSVA